MASARQCYERKELLDLRFHPASRIKPPNLPDIDIILDKPMPPTSDTRRTSGDSSKENKHQDTLLHTAIVDGNLQTIDSLLNQGNIDVNSRDSDGKTPLHLAVESGDQAIVSKLLDAGADRDLYDSGGKSPVHWAILKENAEILRQLIHPVGGGANVDAQTKDQNQTSLHIAARKGDVDCVKQLIEAGADIHLVSSNEWTPLHFAAQWGHVEPARILLNSGSKVDLRTKGVATPLHLAAKHGHTELVCMLIDAKADVNATVYERTPLHVAADREYEPVEIASKLLDSGAVVDPVTKNKWTPLHFAARKGHIKLVNKLLDAGADVDLTIEDGSSALHLSSFQGHGDVVKRLIAAGAKLNLQNTKESKTPLQLAAEKAKFQVLNILLDAGAKLDPGIDNEIGGTAIQLAAMKGDLERLTKLLDSGSDVNSGKPKGQTALHLAALMGHLPVVEKLLDSGADLNAAGWIQRTPLHEAANAGHLHILKRLIAAGAELNPRDKYGVTPLASGAKMRHLDILEAMIDAGGNVNLGDHNNRTALHLAAREGQLEIVKILIRAGADATIVDEYGNTPLNLASKGKHYRVERTLLDAIQKSEASDTGEVSLVALDNSTGLQDTWHIPVEILSRGEEALRAYRKALEHGKTHDRRVPVMIVGQDRSGKTSLKKSLKGDKFDPNEDSTDGIEVDPTLFQSTAEVWRAKGSGETLKDAKPALSRQISDAHAREMRRYLSGESSDFVEEEIEGFGVEIEGDRGACFDAPRTRGNVSESSDASAGAEFDPGIRDAGTALLGTDSGNVPPSLGGLNAAGPVPQLASNSTSIALANNLEDVESVPDEIMHLVLNQEEPEKTDDDIDFILWDFAGQSVFYTTHGLFLSRIAIYVLTHDLSQKLQDRAVPLVRRDMFERPIEDETEMTNLDYIHWWLSSIHCYSRHSELPSPDSEHLPANLPPVFLAGTHADKCLSPRKVAMEVFPDLQGKVYEKHVMTEVFAVDNTRSGSECEDGGVKELRAAVLQAARELPDMRKLFPVKWLQLEEDLEKERTRGMKHTTLAVLRQKVRTICGADEENDFRTVVNFLHDRHALLHFSTPPELDQLVVLDRQWLIDLFKQVITVQPIKCQKAACRDHWRQLERNGILNPKLVEHQWKDLISSEETVSSLLLLLEKFSLTCRWPQADGSQAYLVPSMLETQADSKSFDLIWSAEVPALVVRFHDQYLPFGVFPRLVVRCAVWCLRNWPAKKQRQPKLYKNFARFFLEGGYQVVLAAKLNSVSVSLAVEKTVGMRGHEHKRKLASHCRTLFNFVKNAFGEMLEEHPSYELCFECPVCSKRGVRVGRCDVHRASGCTRDQCLHYVTHDELLSHEDPVCHVTEDPTRTVIHREQFAPWFQTSDAEVEQTMNQPGRGLEANDVPSEKLLNDLSKEIIPEWQSMARQLGVDEGTIQNITFSNVPYPTQQQKAFQALLSWREESSSSTFAQLSQALRHEGRVDLAEKYCDGNVSWRMPWSAE